MDVLVCYDVATEEASGRRRLRRVANICTSFGQRVQKSVFECSVNEMQMEKMRGRLLESIDEKLDSLRIYRLIEPRGRHVETYGRESYVDFEGPLVV